MSKIFQHNSYTTLYGGFYEGTITAAEALKQGDAGIGTLDGADGEVVILDGVAYHGNSQNQVRLVKSDEKLPYVALLQHSVSVKFDRKNLTGNELLSNLTENFPSKNTPFSIKISGVFKFVEISSKPAKNGQTPYLEILAHQPHFKRENVRGTIVGIWSPECYAGLYGNGYHLHFISDDRKFGAHLVDFSAENVSVEAGQIDQMTQEFPVKSDSFQKMKF